MDREEMIIPPAALPLSPSEALYGFCAWLTIKPETISLGGTHECGQVVDLLRQFCERNELPSPREGYAALLKCEGD